jgi:hypothetical protein
MAVTPHTDIRCRHFPEAYPCRSRLPRYLRPLRLLGFALRAYRCPKCRRRVLRWR